MFACPLGWHSGGDRLDINRRTIANNPNSPYPHVVLNETASLRHADFATQFLVHIPQLCWRLIALAYEWNALPTAFALRQTSMLSDMGYSTADTPNSVARALYNTAQVPSGFFT